MQLIEKYGKKAAAATAVIIFLGSIGYTVPKLAMSDDLEALKGDYYASQCEVLHSNYLRLMETKDKHEHAEQSLPDWLIKALAKNATDKAKYKCSY